MADLGRSAKDSRLPKGNSQELSRQAVTAPDQTAELLFIAQSLASVP